MLIDVYKLPDLSTEEKNHADFWLEKNKIESVIDCEESSEHFTWSYRMYDTLADCEGGEVARFTVTYKDEA